MNVSYEILKSILCGYLKACSIRRRVLGAFPLPAGPKIIAANHAYATDAFHLPFLFHEPVHFVMQKSGSSVINGKEPNHEGHKVHKGEKA